MATVQRGGWWAGAAGGPVALIALTSAKGSPGVSTAALAFALTWRARVVLAECDPAGGDLRAGPLAGLAIPIERGLVGLAMAEARGRLAEEFWGQLVDLDPPGRRRLALPGLQRSGQALTLRGAWPPIAACFSALEPAGYHLVADCGRLATSYPPWPVFQRSDLILLALRPSPGGVAAAWSALGDLRRHLIEADLAIDSIGLLTIGARDDCRSELERVLQCRVLVELPDDARSTAALTGRSAGQRPVRRGGRGGGALLRAAAAAELVLTNAVIARRSRHREVRQLGAAPGPATMARTTGPRATDAWITGPGVTDSRTNDRGQRPATGDAAAVDVDRLDLVLRSLAADLIGRPGRLPDPLGVLVEPGAVRLRLAAACPNPPPPWQDRHQEWLLPRAAVPADTEGGFAALPLLAAVAGRGGSQLLVDLERLGCLLVTGDPARRAALLRYLASELALNPWAEEVEVVLAGFEPAEAALLVALNPDRIGLITSVDAAATRLRRRMATALATLEQAGVPDTLAGRLRSAAADPWAAQVWLIAEPDLAELAALRDAVADWPDRRCGIAVVVSVPTDVPATGRWVIDVAAGGEVRLPPPWTGWTIPVAAGPVEAGPALTVAGLPMPELERLVGILRSVREHRAELAQGPAIEDGPKYRQAEHVPLARSVPAGQSRPHAITAVVRPRHRSADPELDADLAAWRAGTSDRPRLSILGPVTVETRGPAPAERARFYAEIVIFLAQRGDRGADREQLDEALWPERGIKDASRRVAMARARRWLGEADDGKPWLPEMGSDRRYRLRPGYLLDWHLFQRLRTRGEEHGQAGGDDLRAALALVRGVPLDGADRRYAAGARDPYPWLAASGISPDHLVAVIVDTAHRLARMCLDADDPAGARWAVGQAWLADSNRGYDQPWRDLLVAQHRAGHQAQLLATVGDLLLARDTEIVEDLDPATFQLVLELAPDLVRSGPSQRFVGSRRGGAGWR